MNTNMINAAGSISQALPRAVIALKSAGYSKSELEALASQAAQATTACCYQKIYVESIVIVNNLKDLEKRVKILLNQKELEYLVLYSGKQLAETERQYIDFVRDMRDWYALKTICYR